MRSYTAVALLLLALGQPLYAQKSAESVVRVREGAPLAVECEVPVERRAEWRVDGRAPAGDLRAAGEASRAGGAVLARLEAPAARARHAGRYTCSPGPAGDARAVRLLVLPATDNSSGGTEPPARDYIYDLGKFIALNCSSAVPELDSASYTWSKNGSALDSWADLRDRYKLSAGGAVLNVTRAYEADWGQYECAAGAGAGAGATVAVARWTVGARPIAKLPADSSVVEGQRLNLTCRVLGKPAPPVQWYYTESLEENATVHLAAERLGADRVTFSANAANVSGAVLVVEAARVADAGVYWCAPEGGTRAHTTLRVKDMYAALWPFLGICAEVFVLCAIILVYEKRRTKPELDDSDTDNHDQ